MVAFSQGDVANEPELRPQVKYPAAMEDGLRLIEHSLSGNL